MGRAPLAQEESTSTKPGLPLPQTADDSGSATEVLPKSSTPRRPRADASSTRIVAPTTVWLYASASEEDGGDGEASPRQRQHQQQHPVAVVGIGGGGLEEEEAEADASAEGMPSSSEQDPSATSWVGQHRVVRLTRRSIPRYVSKWPSRPFESSAARRDWIRLSVLLDHGGVWIEDDALWNGDVTASSRELAWRVARRVDEWVDADARAVARHRVRPMLDGWRRAAAERHRRHQHAARPPREAADAAAGVDADGRRRTAPAQKRRRVGGAFAGRRFVVVEPPGTSSSAGHPRGDDDVGPLGASSSRRRRAMLKRARSSAAQEVLDACGETLVPLLGGLGPGHIVL
eukprot:CAMPEP_0185700132 /NCGR_PEP_ID=MMETSP1164-20130828/7320_1 /TAXON_ID=1104430 /ORGANISM="Chrysoreinhardia sp, Strain CCMP2950" /LENGTH=344 /DNA_ID=CAMNT_0028367081 /DNA_START=11 /DNA_END=1045 /DNA_ORIENTATION=+